jgi:hypothetical protein
LFYTYDTITPLICCFLLPTTMITTATITSTTTIIVLTSHIKQTKTKTTFQATQYLYHSCPIFYFLVILLLRECSSCFFSLSFSCRNCYCCAVNIVFVIDLMYVFVLYIHIFVQYAYFCSCLHWLPIYFVIYQSDSYIMMEFDPIHDIIAGSTTTFYAGYCATSPSSFVSTTPQFCDKELHPFFFLFTNSVFFSCFMVLTFCMQKDQIDIWY